MERKPRGFENCGNTCYLACALHLLLQMDELWSVLLKHCKLIDWDKAPFSRKWFPMVSSYFEGYGGILRLSDIMQTLSVLHADFRGREQQDCHEAMEKILDILHAELEPSLSATLCETNIISRLSTETYSLWNDDNMHGLMMVSDTKWRENMSRMNKLWLNWMYGQNHQLYRCRHCDYRENRWELFQFYWLPSIQEEVEGKTFKNMEEVWKFWLSGCQNRNAEVKDLTTTNCEKCNHVGSINYSQYVMQYPRYWVMVWRDPIQWKQYDLIFKKWSNIEFEVNPVFPYLEKYRSGKPLRYRLKGWVQHYGRIEFGHYRCVLLERGCNPANTPEPIWWLCDDETVSAWKPESGLGGYMYIMLWEQIHEEH